MLKAVIFDLDDTLLDWTTCRLDWLEYEREHLRAVYDYMQERHPLPAFEEFVALEQTLTAEAWQEGVSTLVAPHQGRVLAETFTRLGVPAEKIDITACLEAYNWAGVPGVQPFPEVPGALEELRRHALRLGIITNAYQPMWMRDREMAAAGLPPALFEWRTSTADFGLLKPHPAVFEHTLQALDARPEEAVFIGDNLAADVAGAQGVGMKAVLRCCTRVSVAEGITPDATLRSLEELPALLDDWFPGWQNGHARER